MKLIRNIFLTLGICLLFSLTACSKNTTSSVPDWNASTVIQEMNKYAFIEHPHTWHETIKKYSYGKKIHSLKKLNQVLYIGNKHASAVNSMNTFENVHYPKLTIQDNLQIINVPSFYSLRSQARNKYIKTLKYKVDQVSTKQPIILNFSNNLGGDYRVMVAGLANFIPNGKLLSEVTKNGKATNITLNSNTIKQDNHTVLSVDSHHLINRKVFVITNENTASAAEYTLIALAKNSNVITIGYPTAGCTTGTTGFKFGPSKKYIALIPNSKLIASRSINGRKTFCNNPVTPDIQTMYRPINNPLNSSTLSQTPLDKDFIDELKKHI
ncbi:S41 family peptidase [Lactobacillus crispatus]|jgi:C-terminal processing protease CtpA/Prc|uniref:Tail specific protease domain-containing protein n=1 Tax=Lactobacillus crispatus TaxID=47770 RepID=A0A7X4HM03_9LACO|nr:S41 family peptidase [Lactobacillus crispatus]MBW0436314.1 hypothetical protein [Lactobacillus crispatus]MBW0443065.1 hypothetical protein [Lactobacillus crispatus]MBW0455024.1 hypothetical protein [Lactobacillus crispatus]MCT3540474.1 hypothetical protein [Lactobacillus crispatus]MYN53260.1 hypothetical protein [Lactobacillus crispatus]